jgi:hypothetical protein
LPTPQVFSIKIIPTPWMNTYRRNFICEFSINEWMIFFNEHGQIFMDEKLNFDEMKFIHVIAISKRTPLG